MDEQFIGGLMIDVELHEDENFLNYSLCGLEVRWQPRGHIEVPEQPIFSSSLPCGQAIHLRPYAWMTKL